MSWYFKAGIINKNIYPSVNKGKKVGKHWLKGPTGKNSNFRIPPFISDIISHLFPKF